MKRVISIETLAGFYDITEDGMVYSLYKGRWMKPHVNTCGYVYYFITFGVDKPAWVFAHTLVAMKYIGAPPTNKHEIHHIDGNRMNNHFSNLEWVTHSENQKRSYDELGRDRASHWQGANHPSPTLETRMKMSDAKKKAVELEANGKVVSFDSIGGAAAALKTYRKKIYLCIKEETEFRGGILRFAPEAR